MGENLEGFSSFGYTLEWKYIFSKWFGITYYTIEILLKKWGKPEKTCILEFYVATFIHLRLKIHWSDLGIRYNKVVKLKTRIIGPAKHVDKLNNELSRTKWMDQKKNN